MNGITLTQGDCLEKMSLIPDKTVDLILCDLPYEKSSCKWDKMIPLEPLWNQYHRVIKENGAICLFGIEPFASMLRTSNLKEYKYDWIWRKPRGTGHLNAKKQPLRDVESISVFYKKQCTYNPQFSKGTPYSANKSGKATKIVMSGKTVYGTYYDGAEHKNDNTGFRYPKQVIEFGVVERGTLHPTQKPVPLLEYLIRTYTNEGDVVLDNCMGSGSTAIACIGTNRAFIGIELDRHYFNVAKERILKYMLLADDNSIGA
ncbi:MAG: site-specific DNA-methyltransferase [Ruminiclostridium sp.]|nr:site-specific DNA-methyltransferase [Ruminiclostridium sp.]